MDTQVEAFIIAWNRADTIHLTIKHYQQFCQRIVIFDNYSDDKTREIALQLGADVRLFGTKGVLDDQAYVDVKNECWKTSRADWVIVCDDDEILWHPDLKKLLIDAAFKGQTVFKPRGFSMFSESMPVKSWLDIKTGVEEEKYSKLCCFNPKQIQSINYVFGCHEANPKGSVIYNYDAFLLHYHAVGGSQRMIDRHALYEPRRLRSPVNVKYGLGKEYGDSPESKRIWFKENIANSSTLSVFV